MTREEKSLVTLKQQEVPFYGDALIAILADDNQIYVSVRHMCDALGLTRQGQVRRIKRQPILEDGFREGVIMAPPGAGGGNQRANFLRVDLVPLWLAGIDTKRVKDDIRPKLEKYQREAARVLWEAFQEGRLTTVDPDFGELMEQASQETVEAYKLAMAVVKLARGQIVLEARMENVEGRLAALEAQMGDESRTVSEQQASQISQAVKAVAIAQGKVSKRNEFGAVYGEMYRKYGITSYKLLPTNLFSDCMAWLSEWHQSLTGEAPF